MHERPEASVSDPPGEVDEDPSTAKPKSLRKAHRDCCVAGARGVCQRTAESRGYEIEWAVEDWRVGPQRWIRHKTPSVLHRLHGLGAGGRRIRSRRDPSCP